MLRKSPNIESWSLSDEYFTEKSLKKHSFGQSFTKLYICPECNHWLKRIYEKDLWLSMTYPDYLDCPKCGLKKIPNPNEYGNTFSITGNDLRKFANRLREIDVIRSKQYVLCTLCDVEIGSTDELGGLITCPICGGETKIKIRDEFNGDFLKLCKSNTGLWFEWFVYEIAKQIYEYVDCGLKLSYVDKENKSKEKEVDIIALDDDKLIYIECKDYLGHTPPHQYETTIDIAPNFDCVYVVNFFKPHKDVKKMVKHFPNLKVLNGEDIDDVFLDRDFILSQLSMDDKWFGTGIISSISIDKKRLILQQIFDNCHDRNMIKALIKIIDSGSIDLNFLFNHFSSELKTTLSSELKLISEVEESRTDISDNLKLVTSFYNNFDKEQLSSMFNPSQILDLLTDVNKLAKEFDTSVRTIYSKIFNLYSINDFDLSIIDNNTLFDQIFDDLCYSYFQNYNWRERVSTLIWIEFIFEKINNIKIHSFTQIIEKEFKNPEFHTGDVADWMFKIFSNFYYRFEDSDERLICESANYLNEKGINDFVRSSAKRFLEKCNETE